MFYGSCFPGLNGRTAVLRDLWWGTSGPRGARIALVGEAWGREEAAARQPFVGMSGQLLNEMLAEAGLSRADCFATNLVAAQPPGNEMWRFFHPSKGSPVIADRGLHPTAETAE